MTPDEGEKIFRQMKGILARGGAPFVVHQHEPTRTSEEAERNHSFAGERLAPRAGGDCSRKKLVAVPGTPATVWYI